MFEYKTQIEGRDEPVTLVFKDYGDVPGRVSRYNIGRIEAQIWASLEWGLVEPANWPEDSTSPGNRVFDEMPQRDITTLYAEWQKASGL